MDISNLTAADWTLISYLSQVTKSSGKVFPWWRTLSTATRLPVDVVRQCVNNLVVAGLLVPEDGYYGVCEFLYSLPQRSRLTTGGRKK